MFGPESSADRGTALLLSPSSRYVDPADQAGRALRNSPYLVLRNVACDYDGGVLTLRGSLPTYYLKQVAQAVVAGVDGVRQVVNDIAVV
jgi:hypothetical protein